MTVRIEVLPSDPALAGGGEMGERMRAFDWAQTSLGPVANWPSALRTCVRTVLASHEPMFVWWGKDLVNLYNDAHAKLAFGRNVDALGQPAHLVWRALWDRVGASAESVLRGSPASYDPVLLMREEDGSVNETYATFELALVPGEGNASAGLLGRNTNQTRQVIVEREFSLLRELGARTSGAGSPDEVWAHAATALSMAERDIPFALVYAVDVPSRAGSLVAPVGISAGHPAAPERLAAGVDSPWPLEAVLSGARPFVLVDVTERHGSLPSGPWPRAPRQAAIVPVVASRSSGPVGALIIGLNPYRHFDDAYRSFISLIAGQVGGALARARALAPPEVELSHELAAREKHARMNAERASRAKDEFLAMLGHELRNPLAPIVTALQLMRLRGDSTGERERQIIERQVAHLVRLVDDLLDISRITRGKLDLKREAVELATIVANGVDIASPLFEQRRHHLEIDVPAQGLLVDGDVTRLSQVVSNLLTNAAKYTTTEGHIVVTALREEGNIVLRVRDDGMGISPEMLPHVFDLFVQEQQALDRSLGGLGLGLSIVRSLVERHGGTVSAWSEGPGHGSEFTVRLPAAEGVVSSPAIALTDGERRRSDDPLRVLVVDDNVDACEMLREWLLSLGNEVRVAHDGLDALDAANRFAPDVVVLDIGLPVWDGYEVARRLRERGGFEQTMLVAVTGYGQASDRERSRAAGFDAHLVKPVDFDALAALLDAHAAERRTAEEKAKNTKTKASAGE